MESKDRRIVRLQDTRLAANSENQVTYVVEEGAAVSNYQVLNSDSISSEGVTWNLNNIADATCRDSRMAVDVTVQIAFNVTNSSDAAVNLITADNFGFKQYPFNRIVSSNQHQINGASYTMNTHTILDALARLNQYADDANYYDNTQPDIVDSYLNATGSELTPLASYSSTIQGDGVFKPRTIGYTVTGNSVAANSTATVTVTARLWEPLISPFNTISKKDARGLYAITGEIITLKFISDLGQMFALYAPPNITVNSYAVSFPAGYASLRLQYLQGYKDEKPPYSSVYPYLDTAQIFNQSIGAFSANSGVVQVSTPVCTFNNIPQKILVWCRQKDLAGGATALATPDKYLAIRQISVEFDNANPVLSNANARQLWELSSRNGLVMPRTAWLQQQLNATAVASPPPPGALFGCGSVLVLDPAMNLNLAPGKANGSKGKYVFQANLQVENATGTNFSECNIYVLGLQAAQLERVGGEYRNYLLTLPDDVLDTAKSISPITHQLYLDAGHSNGFLSGGGIGDWFKKAFQGVKSAVKKAADWVGEHKGELQQGYQLAKGAHDLIAPHLGGEGMGGEMMPVHRPRPPVRRKRDMFYE